MSEVHNLGSWFDSNFSVSIHISKSCSAAFFWLPNIKKIRFRHRIDYCSGLLHGLPDCEITKLQRVQNAAARLLTSTRKYDGHIMPGLQELRWCPVRYRLHFKILLLNGMVTAYISDLIDVRKHTRYSLRSNTGTILLRPAGKVK